MSTQHPHKTPGVSRRALLKTGMVAGVTLSAWPLVSPLASWGAEAGQPKRGGILRVRGVAPPHFDLQLTAMVKAQRRTQDLEARWKTIFAMQRYAAEQQYYVYLFSQMITGSWQPYVKNYAPNQSFDYGSPAAALWLER